MHLIGALLSSKQIFTFQDGIAFGRPSDARLSQGYCCFTGNGVVWSTCSCRNVWPLPHSTAVCMSPYCNHRDILPWCRNHESCTITQLISNTASVMTQGGWWGRHVWRGGGEGRPMSVPSRLQSLPIYTPISTRLQLVLISVNVWTLPDTPTSLLPKGVSDNHIPTMSRGLSFHFF